MNRSSIQDEVKQVHKEIWKQKEVLGPERQLTALGILEPDAAGYLLGFAYEKYSDIGSAKFANGPKIAGLIDRQANKIAISTEYAEHIQRVTDAHEVGHVMLHDGLVMHRDRPVGGAPRSGAKTKVEQEADYFAACFLMPTKLLQNQFEFQFDCKGEFHFTDTAAYHLNQTDHESLLFASKESLDWEFALARCEFFAGRRLVSLAKQFRVSDTAMALRINELGEWAGPDLIEVSFWLSISSDFWWSTLGA